MKITILGAGAMGMLYGAMLSSANDVTLIDVNQSRVDAIEETGVGITEPDGSLRTFYPKARCSCDGMEVQDLIILFVKSMYSQSALEQNRAIIGPGTFVMSLQNGSGHEDILLRFVPEDKVVLGATQHNSSIAGTAQIHHGGGGNTYIGLLNGAVEPLMPIQDAFESAGIITCPSDNILYYIWNKMFLNVSGSVLTAILQVKLGYLVDDAYAWKLVEQLTREAVAVAAAKGLTFDADAVVAANRKLLEEAREGYTSIYADIRDGRKTEVDSISGSVIRAAEAAGVPVPTHECVVNLIHAAEGRTAITQKG